MRIPQLVAWSHPRLDGIPVHRRRVLEGCTEPRDEATAPTNQVSCSPGDGWIGRVSVRWSPLTVMLEDFADVTRATPGVVTSTSDYEAFGSASAAVASAAQAMVSAIPVHMSPERLADADAPIATIGGRIRTAEFKLSSWADVVADTRKLYSQVRLQSHLTDRGCPHMPPPPAGPRAVEPVPTESA
jgi:hypothetical protein